MALRKDDDKLDKNHERLPIKIISLADRIRERLKKFQQENARELN